MRCRLVPTSLKLWRSNHIFRSVLHICWQRRAGCPLAHFHVTMGALAIYVHHPKPILRPNHSHLCAPQAHLHLVGAASSLVPHLLCAVLLKDQCRAARRARVRANIEVDERALTSLTEASQVMAQRLLYLRSYCESICRKIALVADVRRWHL